MRYRRRRSRAMRRPSRRRRIRRRGVGPIRIGYRF
ncbi:MAG: hypothetical protein [Arizlama microvirus]|nr:MAG: hypothetical protein [Arizlama microvirus]